MTGSMATISASMPDKLRSEDTRNGGETEQPKNSSGNGTGSAGNEIFFPYNSKQSVTLSSSTQPSSGAGSDVSGADNSSSTSSTSSTSSPNSVVLNMKQNGNSPVCKNCLTVTTPLWRRDENGAVLCNACGLFLKLHGRPRPISLKTDVIKSRNRKGTHNHHNSEAGQQTSSHPTSPRIVEGHKRTHSDDKRRRKTGNAEGPSLSGHEGGHTGVNSSGTGNSNANAASNGLRIKRAKINDTNQLTSSESKDIRSAATTLEILMSSDSSKPKLKPKLNSLSAGVQQEQPAANMSPRLAQSHSATQLPHLSSLLGEVPQNASSAKIEDRYGSPKLSPQGTSMSKQASYHVTSINDVLNESTNANSNPIGQVSSAMTPNGFKSIPITAGSSSSSLIREQSTSQHCASPPPSVPTHIASSLPVTTQVRSNHQQLQHHQQPLQQNNDDQHRIITKSEAVEIPLHVTLQNEEEVIKLKTRISELELVTDLYKRHIFELDEKCRSLQIENQHLKH